MKKLLTLLLLVSSFANAGQITGTITTATSGPIQNGTLTLTPTQAFVVAGTATVVSSPVACYTDGNGNVVGEPNPLVAPTVTPNTASGTLVAGTYFIRFTYYDASGESVASFETTTLLGSTGTLIVTPPTRQPATATGYRIYISTSSSSETLQSTQVGFPTYQQSSALVAGSALPSSNTSACKLFFNDQGSPTVGYTATLTNSSGATISGFPQRWRLMGGAAGTVNLSNGTPLWDGSVQYPTAILGVPAFNASQSISGGLSLGGPISAPSASISGALNNFRTVTDLTAGADLGAKINTAAAAAGTNGTIIVSPGMVATSITTPLILPTGTQVFLPPGVFNLVGGNTISNIGVGITGSGTLQTILKPTSATGDIFTLTGSNFNIGGMGILPSVPRTAGAFLNIQTQQGRVHDIVIQDTFDGFVQGANASSNTFTNIIAEGGGGNWHNVFRNGPLSSGTIPATVIDNFIIALSQGGSTISGDLFVLDSGTDSTKINALEISRTAGADANIGIRIQKTGAAQAPSYVTMVNSYCETTAANICMQIDSTSLFSSENFGFALSLTPLKITGGNGISFHNGFCTLAQQGAVSVTGGNGVSISGMKISDCAQAAANTYDAISLAAGVSGFHITGNRIGNYVFGANSFRNGVTVAAGASDKYVIAGNVIDGFQGVAVSDGGTGVNKTVQVMGGGLTGYSTGSGTGAGLIAEGSGGPASVFEMFNASAGADSKWWEMIGLSGSGTLIFRTLSDNFGVQVPWLTVTRSGQSPLLAAFGVPVSATAYQSATNCAAVGTAASPSVAACGSAAAGQFSCATNATGATCQVNTAAVTANSEIFVFESDTAATGTRLGVTCNTSTTVNPATRLLASSVAATSFTINLGTVTTNPACFSYHIVN